MKLFIESGQHAGEVRRSPAWLQRLMDAWADGLNYYLSTHPAVKPRVITRFEPWMALSFSEGSIGGDIESVDLDALRGLLRRHRRPAGAGRGPARATGPTSRGLERLRDRPGEHGEPPGAPAHQSPHLVLLPLRAPDDERRGAQRLRRGDLGPVLPLPGLQRPARLDAHLDRRRRDRRVRRDGRAEGRAAVLSVWAGRAAGA